MKRSAFSLSVIFFAVFFPLACFCTSPSSLLINDVTYRIELSLKKIDSDLSRTAHSIGKDVLEPDGKKAGIARPLFRTGLCRGLCVHKCTRRDGNDRTGKIPEI